MIIWPLMTQSGQSLMDDYLAPDDAIRAIFNGIIIKRQWENQEGEYKYLIQGRLATGGEIVVVAKIEQIEQVEWTAIITVYMV